MSQAQPNSANAAAGPAPSVLRSALPVVCVFLGALGVHLFVRPMLGDFPSKILLDIGINVVLAVSLTIVNGFTGQFSMGHAAFMAVGGYCAAAIVYYGSALGFGDTTLHAGKLSTMMATHAGAPWLTMGDLLFVGALLCGGLLAAACGWLVGLPSLRLKGDYLAIVTLGFGEIFRVMIQQTTDVSYDIDEIRAAPILGIGQLFTKPREEWQAPLWDRVGGALGFTGVPTYNSLFWTMLAAGLTILVAYRIKRSTHGRALLSIREDEIAAEAMGVNVTKYKVRAFVIAAFFAGVAGGLFAHTTGVALKSSELGFIKSFDIIIMVVLGGLGSISGATLAAIILTMLPELLRGVNEYRMITYALALILMMLLRPQGLFGVREIWDRAVWAGFRRGQDGAGVKKPGGGS